MLVYPAFVERAFGDWRVGQPKQVRWPVACPFKQVAEVRSFLCVCATVVAVHKSEWQGQHSLCNSGVCATSSYAWKLDNDMAPLRRNPLVYG